MHKVAKYLILSLSLLVVASITFSASINLKATWEPNTEPDVAKYKLYRVDGSRKLVHEIPHPPSLPFYFTITVPDGSEGVMSFVLTAVDTSGNESGDSNQVNVPFDFVPPAAPGGFRIVP